MLNRLIIVWFYTAFFALIGLAVWCTGSATPLWALLILLFIEWEAEE